MPHGAGKKAAPSLLERPPAQPVGLCPISAHQWGGHAPVTPSPSPPAPHPKPFWRMSPCSSRRAWGAREDAVHVDPVLAAGAAPLPAGGEPRGGGKELGTTGTARRGAQGGGKKMLGIFGTRGMQGMPGPQQGMWWGTIQHQGGGERGKGDRGRVRAGWENCLPFSEEPVFCSHVPGEPWTHGEGVRVCKFQRGKLSLPGEGPRCFYNIRVKGKARKSTRSSDVWGAGGHPSACTSLLGALRGLGLPGRPARGRVRVQRRCRCGVSPAAPLSHPNPWHAGTVRAASGDGRRERDD